MIDLALIRRPRAMPEEQPLQRLAPLELILEAEHVILIRELEEVEELSGGFHDGEGRRLGVVDEDGDAAVGVEAEEPVFLLLVGHDVAGGGRMLSQLDRVGGEV